MKTVTPLTKLLINIGGSSSSRNALIDPSDSVITEIKDVLQNANYVIGTRPVNLNQQVTTSMALIGFELALLDSIALNKFYKTCPYGQRQFNDVLNFIVQNERKKGSVVFVKIEESVPDLLRSCRDICILKDSLHVILTGSKEALAKTIFRHPQISSIFPPLINFNQ